ncbi:hypothetical protein [Halalkalicoccus salilacus]|jgi:hypothetical protein|uniref:hypothetical protein n=1 Tax=Halalkalicoccus TaxID=332246 RepID=UPI002F96E349
MKDIYRELMRRSIKDAYDVVEASGVEGIQNVDQFALELYRFRVMAHAQKQQSFAEQPPRDWDRQ